MIRAHRHKAYTELVVPLPKRHGCRQQAGRLSVTDAGRLLLRVPCRNLSAIPAEPIRQPAKTVASPLAQLVLGKRRPEADAIRNEISKETSRPSSATKKGRPTRGDQALGKPVRKPRGSGPTSPRNPVGQGCRTRACGRGCRTGRDGRPQGWSRGGRKKQLANLAKTAGRATRAIRRPAMRHRCCLECPTKKAQVWGWLFRSFCWVLLGRAFLGAPSSEGTASREGAGVCVIRAQAGLGGGRG